MTVLVVDDEAKMAQLLGRSLVEAGFEVEIAASGQAAVLKARDPGYEAIVLDVTLPDIDGVEACRRMRRQGTDSPVLLVSARAAIEDRRAGLEAGADAYLVKPFSLRDLTVRLRDLVTQGRAGA